jgi:hypothetical protein
VGACQHFGLVVTLSTYTCTCMCPRLYAGMQTDLCCCSGTDDIAHSYNHFVAFFEEKIDAMLDDIDSLPPADIQGEIEDPSCQHVGGS